MAKNNQGNPSANQQGNRNQGNTGARRDGGRPGQAANQPSLEDALNAMLMQDWFRAGFAEAIAALLESNTAPAAVRDWVQQRISTIIAEGEQERRDVLESWAEDANQLQEMARDFQSQQQEMQQLIKDEQRHFDAIASRLRK